MPWTQGDEVSTEWKTIRIEAPDYFKLVELSGFLSILFGKQVSLSDVAHMTIDSFYDTSHAALIKAVSNPDIVEKTREKFKAEKERMEKLLEPLMKAEKSGE
jgi:hypothetical protein